MDQDYATKETPCHCVPCRGNREGRRRHQYERGHVRSLNEGGIDDNMREGQEQERGLWL
ncbi:potassium channel, subfamily K, member 13b [Sesbania bispinosa]|nr:potassium channel, subfamily K, member 13b [Sesbania bispinosa]